MSHASRDLHAAVESYVDLGMKIAGAMTQGSRLATLRRDGGLG
jgi:hypothetical protein